MFTCFSCLLMVWHTIVLLLMFCYDYDSKQAFAVRFLMVSSGIFVVANWAFWRDFVRNYRDSQDEERLDFVGLYKLQLLCKMYKSKVITSHKVADLRAASGSEPLSCAAATLRGCITTDCDMPRLHNATCSLARKGEAGDRTALPRQVLNGHLHGLISRLLDEYQIRTRDFEGLAMSFSVLSRSAKDSKRPSEAWLARAAEVSIIPEPDLEASETDCD
ncbi:unnamed protein product [Symbiodinium necroappetens]|uniref:Uncharacterized protein n=1 Tax=Symbiodinium necroappetens TaxID=1628268 RepID=A0A812XD54_9DINO|nr:unnamed protein product [Symbiodinium necroappetens]